jgi:hypothetical protein
MNKVISLRYSGKCRKCGKMISAGNRAYWHGGRRGISHYPQCDIETEDRKPEKPKKSERAFIIDWGRVRETYLALIEGRKTPSDVCKRRNNQSVLQSNLDRWTSTDGPRWTGASSNDMKTWIRSGFHVPGIENASPELIPTRQRRKLKFSEDGELQLDLALSGFDYPFLEWEKRERKPGMKIEVGMCFASSTDAPVVVAYERWVAQLISTLEEFGYDLEVNIVSPVDNSWIGNPGREKTIIRVKRENEASDFSEWSALFSPGGYRHLVFLATIMGADENGQDITTGLGTCFTTAWEVSLDGDTRVMEIGNPMTPRDFPEASMSEKFISLVQAKH